MVFFFINTLCIAHRTTLPMTHQLEHDYGAGGFYLGDTKNHWDDIFERTRDGQMISEREMDEWFYNNNSMMPGTSRTIVGTAEADGCAATGHEHSLYEEDYDAGGMGEHAPPLESEHMPSFAESGWRPGARGRSRPSKGFKVEHNLTSAGERFMIKERMAYPSIKAENARRAITEFHNQRIRVIRPRREDKMHHVARVETGALGAVRDRVNEQWIDYDRVERAQQANRLLKEQRDSNTLFGQVLNAISEVFTPSGVDAGGEDKLYNVKRGPTSSFVKMEAAPSLAASLLSRPSNALQRFYSMDPHAADTVKAALEEIALVDSDGLGLGLTEHQQRCIDTVVMLHFQFADKYKIYDERMLEFVVPSDNRCLEMGALKREVEQVQRYVSDIFGHVPDGVNAIIFPLVVHLRRKNLPITVENVIGEIDYIDDLTRTFQSLSHGSHRFEGGVRSIISLANQRQLEIMNRYDPDVLELMFRGFLNRQGTVYLEQHFDGPVIYSEMGPRDEQILRHSDVSGGGYRHPEESSMVTDPHRLMRTPAAGPERLDYTPLAEGYYTIYKYAVPKFEPPM